YVSRQPSLEHQYTCDEVCSALRAWSHATGNGMAFSAPGVIFAEDDNVAPDVVWLSRERLRAARGADGKLHQAPELMVEVLSPGAANERRDREAKRKLYARRGVDEYWIVDLQGRRVEVFRQVGGALEPSGTLLATDRLESPLLPGFGISVEALFLAATL
ncbi:MAG: Uma2 family endonuclease, partial [Chloroflexota bacterium]|nr:Uma2 family endonuclease [Chloroflexota bacterium]